MEVAIFVVITLYFTGLAVSSFFLRRRSSGRVFRTVYDKRLVIDLLLRVSNINDIEALGSKRIGRRACRTSDVRTV